MSDANHPANLAELHRRIENLIRTGTVEEVKGDRARIRTGELTTNWIPWLTLRAGDARTWWRPSTSERVLLLCLSEELTTAVALPAIYSDAHPAPKLDEQVHHTVYHDGAVVEYDPRVGALKATGIKTAQIQAETSITLDTPVVTCTQLLETNSLTVKEGGKLTGSFNHSGGSFTSNGVTVHTHTHTGVERGGSNTGGPQ
ncbi:MAG: hypothetical protein CITR_02415 [Citrobacter freundii]